LRPLPLFSSLPPPGRRRAGGSLEGLDLDDDFAVCKILLRGALNTVDAMLCETGLEKTFFVPCQISARTLTISERPPYLLILVAGALEILKGEP